MLKMTCRADLAVFYEADAVRYRNNPQSRATQVVTQDVFCAFYADCPSVGFEMDGVPIGGIVFDGDQAHIAVLPQYHGRWALLLKPALAWLFSLKREIVVEVERDNARCLRFMERSGWQHLRTTGDAVFYCLSPQGGTRKTEYPFHGLHQLTRRRPAADVHEAAPCR
jgi:GNAT superfamily N-acetyltransferase